MASSNKTSLGLTQYSLDDIPDMTDTNNDNVILTAELEKRPEADFAGKYPKAIEADTSGTADAAKNAVEGSALDARLEAIESDVAQQAEELENFPTSGTAAMAKKLETAREIELTGAVTGSAEFDGSGNVNIATAPYGATGGNPGAYPSSNTQFYYKIASTTLTGAFSATSISFFVIRSYVNVTPIPAGLLSIYFRLNSNKNKDYAYIQWLSATDTIDTNNFILCYDDSGDDCKIELYLFSNTNYTQWVFNTLDYNAVLSHQWTLYKNNTYSKGETAIPSNYTKIPSTYSNLRTGLIQTDKSIYNSGFNSSEHAKYMNILRMKLLHAYHDTPVVISFLKRKTNTINTVYIRWEDGSSQDPAVRTVNISGDAQVYIYKSAESTWDLLVFQDQWNDETIITRIDAAWTHPGGFMDVSYPNEIIDTLPEGAIEATYYDPPEIAAQYLKNRGGTVNGNITMAAASNGDSKAIVLNTSNKQLMLYAHGISDNPTLSLYGNGKYSTVPIGGVGNPLGNYFAANKIYVDTQLAALEAKLTGKTVAEVMAANAIPNEAPTLEAPGEEEITV